jgi:iron(III) transport system ATP-binding protein
MAVLDRGVVQQVCPPTELFDRPANAFVANFVGTMNLLSGTVTRRDEAGIALAIEGVGELCLAPAGPVPAGSLLAVGFRPHTVRIEAPDRGEEQGYAWLIGEVEASEFLGEYTRYHVRVGSQSLLADRTHYAGLPRFAPGGKVRLGIEASQVCLFPA